MSTIPLHLSRMFLKTPRTCKPRVQPFTQQQRVKAMGGRGGRLHFHPHCFPPARDFQSSRQQCHPCSRPGVSRSPHLPARVCASLTALRARRQLSQPGNKMQSLLQGEKTFNQPTNQPASSRPAARAVLQAATENKTTSSLPTSWGSLSFETKLNKPGNLKALVGASTKGWSVLVAAFHPTSQYHIPESHSHSLTFWANSPFISIIIISAESPIPLGKKSIRCPWALFKLSH